VNRQAVRRALLRQASACPGASPELQIFARSLTANFLTPTRTAFFGLAAKVKQIVSAFTAAPRLWEAFKDAVGIKSLADIPGALKRLADAAKRVLSKALHKLFDTWPLKIYTLNRDKVLSFNDVLNRLLPQSPKFRAWLDSGVRRVKDFGETLRQKAPVITGVAMLGVYVWVWLNVVEFEWDLKSLTDAVFGNMTFGDFLDSLPGSAMGLLLRAFNFGTFTLLPWALVGRLTFMLAISYIEWQDNKGFTVNWPKLKADFGFSDARI
jgi:hypothetical protein